MDGVRVLCAKKHVRHWWTGWGKNLEDVMWPSIRADINTVVLLEVIVVLVVQSLWGVRYFFAFESWSVRMWTRVFFGLSGPFFADNLTHTVRDMSMERNWNCVKLFPYFTVSDDHGTSCSGILQLFVRVVPYACTALKLQRNFGSISFVTTACFRHANVKKWWWGSFSPWTKFFRSSS